MFKKGFTLIELLATILILSAIILIIAPLIINQINRGEEMVAEQTEDNVIASATNWSHDNRTCFLMKMIRVQYILRIYKIKAFLKMKFRGYPQMIVF